MNPDAIAVDVLLVLGVAAELICCLGLLLMTNVFDRLHYAGAAGTLGPVLLGAAVLVRESLSSAGVKTILTVVVVVLAGTVTTSATARMARLRDQGLEALPEERP